jgi:hypothetical protein
MRPTGYQCPYHDAGYALPISIATDRPGKPIRLGIATTCLIMQPWRHGRALGPGS